jgi:hypothetical protein
MIEEREPEVRQHLQQATTAI